MIGRFRLALCLGSYPQNMANGLRQLDAVESIEVEIIDPGKHEHAALLGGDHGSDGMPQLGFFVEPIE